MSRLRPRPLHRKADPAAQEAFQKGRPPLVENFRKANPGKVVEVWFQDEARVGQQGS